MKILLVLTNNFLGEFKANEKRSLAENIEWHIGNSGNLLFLNGYIAMLEGQNYEFWNEERYIANREEYFEYINHEFDSIIYPLANNITINKATLEPVVERLKKFIIPTYIWGLGLTQYGKFDVQKFDTSGNAKTISELIRCIVKCNGRIFVRGYYSAEILKKYCYIENADDYIIPMGCPSMYQLGCINISKAVVDKDEFQWGMNGLKEDIRQKNMWNNLNKYKSYYIDQDEFARVLLDKNDINVPMLLKEYGIKTTQLVCEGRIKYFYHLAPWYIFVKENIDFMFGHRIHGNLIALLAGKPCTVWNDSMTDDVRTREIAEFYNIPILEKAPKDIYEIYSSVDFQAFNETIEKRYNEYVKVLKELQINENFNPRKNRLEDIEYKDIERNFDVQILSEEYNRYSFYEREKIVFENAICKKGKNFLNKFINVCNNGKR